MCLLFMVDDYTKLGKRELKLVHIKKDKKDGMKKETIEFPKVHHLILHSQSFVNL